MQTLVSVSAACHSVPVERRNKCLSIRVVCHKMTSRKYTVHCPKKHHFLAHSDQNQNNYFFMHWCEGIHSSLINSQFYNYNFIIFCFMAKHWQLSRIVQSPSTADQSNFLLKYLFRQNQASQQYKAKTPCQGYIECIVARLATCLLSMGFLCKLL